MRLVRGSHIVVRKLFDHPYAYFFQLPDGRIFFAIPYERDFTLIGTTDRDHDGPLSEVRASAEEIAYLCEGGQPLLRAQVTPADVVWSYAGVRPLIDDGSASPRRRPAAISCRCGRGRGRAAARRLRRQDHHLSPFGRGSGG